jgi:hypothetical protein
MSGTRFRPALGLHKSEHDEVVAFISSKFPVYLKDSDILVSKDPSILPPGLRVSSVIKFDKIATIAKDLTESEIERCM